MFIPKARPKPQKSVYRERSVPAFRRWIKTLQCSVKGCPNADIDPAHVRCGLPHGAQKGGTGIKPHDAWIIPLCREHHDEQHAGELTFAIKSQIDPVALAETLWAAWLKSTDAGRKWSQAHATPPAEQP